MITIFKCTQCDKKFMPWAPPIVIDPCPPPDFDYYSIFPNPCPRCGSIRTRRWSLLDLFGCKDNAAYEERWKSWEQMKKERENATTDKQKESENIE